MAKYRNKKDVEGFLASPKPIDVTIKGETNENAKLTSHRGGQPKNICYKCLNGPK